MTAFSQLSAISYQLSASGNRYWKLITHASLLITVFLAACSSAPPTATTTPTLVPSLTASPLPTLQPSVTEPPLTATATPFTETPTPTLIAVTIEPLLGQGSRPPLDITLPDGWLVGYDTFVLGDVDREVSFVPLVVYSGPVTGGTGTIVLLWGFSSVVGGVNPLSAQMGTPLPEPDMWTDGLRLLRLAVVEAQCNIGTDLRRDYPVAGLTGTGTQFAAVGCPETSDTRGWFVGVREFGVPYIFYVYTDPIEVMDNEAVQAELQAILDSIRISEPQPIEATPEITAAPEPA